MQLAFVLFNWFPHGGLQQDVVKIARACRQLGEVTVYCMSITGETPSDIPFRIIPCRGLSRTARRAAFARRVQRDLAGRADCIVGFNRLPGLDCYFAADTCFAARAYGERGVLYRLAPRTRQYLAWERAVFGPDSGTQILLLSDMQRGQYLDYYDVPAERLHLLPPGIREGFRPADPGSDAPARLRAELGLQADDLLLLQVGSSFRTKGLDRVLRAIAALPHALRDRVHLCQAGLADSTSLLREAAALGLAHVQPLGPRDDIVRLMQAADLLVHPSRTESAGMVILEALACGLPVVTTASCGYAEHVQRAGAGLVCPVPFRQDALDAALLQALQGDRRSWQHAACEYTRTLPMHGMAQAVAGLLSGMPGIGGSADA